MAGAPGGASRARRSFWILTLLAIAAAGSLSAALGAPPGRATGLRVAVSGLVLVTAVGLAGRILVAFERRRRSSGG